MELLEQFLAEALSPTLVGFAIGVVTGAVIAGISSAGADKIKPDQIKQNYVSNCLSKKGYTETDSRYRTF